ncbi:MAG: HEAT repeat domain-containing protein [Promethearchaeota archaeon]
MLDSKIQPKEVFLRRNELGLDQTIDLLYRLIEESEDIEIRRKAVKYIGLLGNSTENIKKECFKILENILLSVDDEELKCEAAKSLGILKVKSAIEPLSWTLKNKNINSKLKIACLKAISDIGLRNSEIKLFLEQLVNATEDIKQCVIDRLTLLEPNNLISNLLKFLQDDKISDALKKEIIKLINRMIKSINESLGDIKYLIIQYPEINQQLLTYKDSLLNTIVLNLDENDGEFLESAINILKLIKDEIKEYFLNFLEKDDFIIKRNSIELIGKLKIKNFKITSKLIENLDDIYSEVSRAALRTLGEIGDEKAIPELLKILNEEEADFEYIDVDLKWCVIDSIKKILMNTPQPDYSYLLNTLDTDNDLIKESVAFILGEIGKSEFTESLISLFLNERNIEVRKSAIIALGKIGNKKALNLLLDVLDNDNIYWLLKKVAIDAIYNIYYRNLKYYNSNSNVDREFIKNREKLIYFLKTHPNECFKVKLGLIKFLETFGDKTALDALIRLLNDFHRLVRISAEKAIKNIEKRLNPEN